MKEPVMPLPSTAFQRGLESFQQTTDPNHPEWLRMSLALGSAYDALTQLGMLDVMFDQTNEFDAALLSWCRAGANRDHRDTTNVLKVKTPLPSSQFLRALGCAEHLINSAIPNVQLPALLTMGASLAYAFRVLRDSGLLTVMFDMDNPFDLSMLIWCAKADEKPSCHSVPYQTDFSRN